ncbi:Hypothetical protein SRAE_0000073500 [Strongyloides ratti]|uniref:Uncharacterized protein n=1 Tax=Strongyloides ratti TaxID=34506 RepID=A0A090MTH1_STRRB|nr:Hypothetical protein SRAE_0000073500 [Strongyloides ratti]CEF61618.2 Hypothetical protein SRAE_0000073500 [Strongyloides ratti]
MVKITNDNVDSIARDFNLLNLMERKERCKIKFGSFVFGCYGEYVLTESALRTQKILIELGFSKKEMDSLIKESMMTKLREFEREKRENCEIKMRENEEKPEEKLNFDNYEEAKLKRGIKCKKEVKPIVIENKD